MVKWNVEVPCFHWVGMMNWISQRLSWLYVSALLLQSVFGSCRPCSYVVKTTWKSAFKSLFWKKQQQKASSVTTSLSHRYPAYLKIRLARILEEALLQNSELGTSHSSGSVTITLWQKPWSFTCVFMYCCYRRECPAVQSSLRM